MSVHGLLHSFAHCAPHLPLRLCAHPTARLQTAACLCASLPVLNRSTTLPPSAPNLQPDNWQQLDPAWLATWVSSHAEAAQKELKKPLVLEEVRDCAGACECAGLRTRDGAALGHPAACPLSWTPSPNR